MLQQSYFVGGAFRFYDKSAENQNIASYIIFGNYPSTSTSESKWDQYGKFVFVKDAARDILKAESSSRRRNLLETNQEKSNELRRNLDEGDFSYAADTLVPNIQKDFGDNFNFIDENEYDIKVQELIDSGTLSES